MKSEERERNYGKSREQGDSGGEDKTCEDLEKGQSLVYLGNRK